MVFYSMAYILEQNHVNRIFHSVCPQQDTAAFRELCPLGVGRSDNGEDFNECEMLEGLCSGGKCVNTDGSYRCECPKG